MGAIKEGSKHTYLNHFIQYIKWCKIIQTPPFTFPIPHVVVAAYLIDRIQQGIHKDTIRGYIAAFKWIHDIVGSEWNSNHFLLKRLRGTARIQSSASSKGAINLRRDHLPWLWTKYAYSSNINEQGAVIGFFIGILIAARGSSLFKGRISTKGIRLKHINVLYIASQHNALFTQWGNYPPAHIQHLVIGVKFELYDIKTATLKQKLIRYIGVTNNSICDPVIALINYLRKLKFTLKFPQNPNDFVFRNIHKQPLSTGYISSWIKQWKFNVPHYDKDQQMRILLHSMRKTFCQHMYEIGWDMVKIGCYGNWAVPTTLIFYYQYTQHEALSIAKLLLFAPNNTSRSGLICDLDRHRLRSK